MKKFLISILCFLMLLSVPLYALGDFYQRSSPIREEFQVPADRMPEQIDYAVVGSSHALFSIDLSPYTDRYFNFSMTGQTPQYDYAMLKQFEGRIADGATVIMTMSYISPFWTEPQQRFLEKQTRYYRVLSRENIVQYDPREAFRVHLNQWIPQTRIFNTDISELLQTARTVLAPVEVPQEAFWEEDDTEEIDWTTQEWTEEYWNLSEYWDEDEFGDYEFWFDDLPRYEEIIRREHIGVIQPVFPEMNPDMAAAYQGIFALAREHGWKLIAVTTPFPVQYNDMFDPEFYEVFYGHVNSLCREGGMEYWDYSHDPRFINSPQLFSDMDHMIPAGCEIFSHLLAKRLGLLPDAG